MAAGQTSNLFAADEFAKSGWIFGLANGRLAVGWGALEWGSRAKSGVANLFAPDFYLQTKTPWLTTASWAVLEPAQILAELPQAPAPTPISWEEPDREAFADTLSHLQDSFCSGLAKKAVPVVFATAESERTSILPLITKLLQVPSQLRVYGFWNQEGGILGATPEVLFERSGARLKSMALAGTRRGVLNAIETKAFLNDAKERLEHQLVVDDLSERFSQWGKPVLDSTKVLQLPTLAHLFTPIEVEAKVGFDEVAQSLHPTPALGVSPRKLGLNWMKTWDKPDLRERFGAPFGFRMDLDVEECLVAIRNIQWHDQLKDHIKDHSRRHWKLGSGCGIVPQSRLESEWEELKAKRESVRSLLGL